MQTLTPFLWIQHPVEQAVSFYTSLFDTARVLNGPDVGEAMSSATVEIAGQRIHLFNAGPFRDLTEAFSLMVSCSSQAEIDRLWNGLADGGSPSRCGWVTDRFGVTWQVIPDGLQQWLSDPVHGQAVTERMLQMDKIEIEPLLAVMR